MMGITRSRRYVETEEINSYAAGVRWFQDRDKCQIVRK